MADPLAILTPTHVLLTAAVAGLGGLQWLQNLLQVAFAWLCFWWLMGLEPTLPCTCMSWKQSPFNSSPNSRSDCVDMSKSCCTMSRKSFVTSTFWSKKWLRTFWGSKSGFSCFCRCCLVLWCHVVQYGELFWKCYCRPESASIIQPTICFYCIHFPTKLNSSLVGCLVW